MTSHDPFVAQLAELARRERTANKWVLVPDNFTGWLLGERLVHEGCNWLNLRFVTPFKLALEAAAPDLLAEGVDPCPEHLGPCLVQSLLLANPGHRFAPLIKQPGMAEALWRTLCECRMAGLRHGELDTLYQAYLDDHRLADRSMVLQRQAKTRVGEGDFVVAYPYHVWPPLAQAFIERLPGTHLHPHATDLAPPRRLAGTRDPQATRPSPTTELFYAGRRDLEFQEVLDRIDVPFDQVELAAHVEDLPLLVDVLAANRCPATFAHGLPLCLSRAGQAFYGLLRWVEEGLSGFQARELLLANLLKAWPDSWTAARLVRAARVGWGKGDFRRQLEILAARTPEDAPEWLQLQRAQALGLADWFDRLFRKLDHRGSLHHWLRGLRSAAENDLERCDEVTPLLTRALVEMELLPDAGWSPRELVHLVRERLAGLRWSASRPRPGHLHVSDLESVGLSGRPVVFLTGLEEGRWSLVPTEDFVLSDAERARLHPALALAEDRSQEMAFHIAERLRTLGGRVTWSFASRDRRGEQEQIPSWLYLQTVRTQNPAVTSMRELKAWLGEPAQPWSRQERRWGARELHPNLARGAHAERERASARLTAYDGWVPAAALRWDPRRTREAISVSTLQALATCPFQFFLTRALKLYPQPMPLPEPDRWLDPSTRGHILHEVYAEHGRRLQRGEPTDLAALRQTLEEQLARELPHPSATVEAAEREALERELAHFLRLEERRGERSPVGVELPFDPVEIDLGEGMSFLLRGRIDRIDRVPGGYSVVDYKTGRSLELGPGSTYARGRVLQHALYALAAEQLVDGPVVESGYYFTCGHAASEWIPLPAPDRQRLREVLNLVMEPLASGAFVHGHELENDCRFCDFRAACASHRDGHARLKLDDVALASRRQLLEVR